MKIREVMKLIERDGWFLVAVRGSHRSIRIQTSQAGSPWQVIRMTISLPGR